MPGLAAFQLDHTCCRHCSMWAKLASLNSTHKQTQKNRQYMMMFLAYCCFRTRIRAGLSTHATIMTPNSVD